MKKFFLFILVLISTLARSQETKWDSNFRPASFALKVDQFKSFPNATSDIIFLGNSITAGVDWSELFALPNARNRGISGDITFGVLERLDEVIEGHPAKVFILIGINDISRNIPDSVILANYRKLIKRIKAGSPNTAIYFQTLLPVNNEFTQFKNHYNKDEHILFVNQELKKIANEENIHLIDLYPHFLGPDNKLDKRYTVDGLHLTAAGYKVWKEFFEAEGFLLSDGLDLQGHRGARGLMPENTIEAMKKAIDLGVTTLEMDLVISKDKKVVVSHDPYFNEMITTAPGGRILSKEEAAQLLIYSMPYDSVKKYDVGLKPHPGFALQEKFPAYKPLLSELLDFTEAYSYKNGRPVNYNIEIKSTNKTDGSKHPPVEEFVDLAMDVINKKNIAGRTIIQSFDPRALQVMHKKYSGISTSLLIEAGEKRTLDQQLKELGFIPAVYSPNASLVTKELVKMCHEKGMKIIPWTINTVQEMRRLTELGVDGLISDYPNLYSQIKVK